MRGRIVGVDAGASSTRVALAEPDGRVLQIATAAAANLARVGAARAAVTIGDAVAALARGEGIAALAVGIAGGGDAALRDALHAALAQRFDASRLVVTHDGVPALRAGVPSGDAMALIAGTGSLAYAEVAGQSFRRGGLGAAFGDEGSGYAIGASALRMLLRALDGRAPRDGFVDALAAHYAADDARALVARLAGEDGVAAVAALAPLVIARAAAGDRSATKIVQAAALDLFELVRALAGACGATERGLPLVFAGGLLRENTLLSYLLETRVGNELPQLVTIKGAHDAALGALAMAQALLRA